MASLKINNIMPICIARQADAHVERIVIDITAWRELYPMLKDYRLEVTSPGGAVYLPEVELTHDKLVWPITASDTAEVGSGTYQVVATGENGERKTSGYSSFTVNETMPGTAGDAPPDPARPWVDEVMKAADRAEAAAKRAEGEYASKADVDRLTEEIADLKDNGGGSEISQNDAISLMLELDALPTLVDENGSILVDNTGAMLLG